MKSENTYNIFVGSETGYLKSKSLDSALIIKSPDFALLYFRKAGSRVV